MQQNHSQLVIRDVPIFQWVLGILFTGLGTLVINQGGPQVFGGIFAAIGAGFLLISSVLTITADRMTRTLKLDHRSALRRTLKQVPFDEIVGINVERRVSGGKGGFTYRLTLLRKDGQVIPFRSSSSSGWNWTTGARWHSPDFKTPGIFLFVAQKDEGQPSRGFLASLGSMFIRQALSLHGFSPEDTPGLEQAVALAPLEPAIERHFMAYTNSPPSARLLLNARVAAQLADWAARYPLKQSQRGSGYGQLMTLFGPNGVYLATLNLLQPDQAHELVSLGLELVKSQSAGLGQFSSSHQGILFRG